ncbi:MAG: tRNA (adenosine(37)-N6)-threonylcarbamoyltransferase complex ATPase subunit type 1 TsaE [Candidatus Saccharimonadales bacterium]
MSVILKTQLVSKNPDATELIATKLGARLCGGEVIELVSDLGGGKTTFVRGLARGMGSEDVVASPTFTISRQYKADNLTLYHFDFYRLNEAGVVADELAELIGDPAVVVVIEWAEAVENILPLGHLTVNFKLKTENSRQLVFTYAENLTYLMPMGPRV